MRNLLKKLVLMGVVAVLAFGMMVFAAACNGRASEDLERQLADLQYQFTLLQKENQQLREEQEKLEEELREHRLTATKLRIRKDISVFHDSPAMYYWWFPITRFLGEYSGVYVVTITIDGIVLPGGSWSIEVAGILFRTCCSNTPIFVWRDGYVFCLQEAYDTDLLTFENLQTIAEVLNRS